MRSSSSTPAQRRLCVWPSAGLLPLHPTPTFIVGLIIHHPMIDCNYWAWKSDTSFGFVLLRHKLRRPCVVGLAPQQGHRARFFTSARIKRVRIVAIEFGTWRSGRKGGSSGSITFG